MQPFIYGDLFELGIGNWELGIGNWELGIGNGGANPYGICFDSNG
jgi:hypothetical protein